MKINLTGSDIQSRSVVASNQRRLNLYSEASDQKQGEPAPVTHYPTPGLSLLATTPNGYPVRGLYRASNGDLYAVANYTVYYVSPIWTFTSIGTMNYTGFLNPVKMVDNGKNIILCDGSSNGYAITMATRSGLAPLFNSAASDALTTQSTGWLGANYVDFSDTYFIANWPGTPTFYISNSEDIIFDATQFSGKNAYPDVLVAAVVQHRVLWLIGQLSTEVFYNAGTDTIPGNNFPFQIMPGVAIDWGCGATYSIAKAETSVFWLAQNLNGQTVVLRGTGYTVQRVSTHGLEHVISTYSVVSDAIGWTYMQQGHTFYVLTFPTADATWVYDLSTGTWHERCWLDTSGVEHMHRSTCHAFAYQTNVVNDWQNGNLYSLDINNYTDNGQPIKRLINFPRAIDPDGDHRISFKSFIAEIDVGESILPADSPTIMLAFSDDKGKTWGNAIKQPLGNEGSFRNIIKWNRLGLSRNRVFQLEWAANAFTALQGAFVDVAKADS